MIGEIYDALTKALVTTDTEGISCYPVRTSAAGALASLLDVIHWIFSVFILNKSVTVNGPLLVERLWYHNILVPFSCQNL
jgi:hypothetical protein